NKLTFRIRKVISAEKSVVSSYVKVISKYRWVGLVAAVEFKPTRNRRGGVRRSLELYRTYDCGAGIGNFDGELMNAVGQNFRGQIKFSVRNGFAVGRDLIQHNACGAF